MSFCTESSKFRLEILIEVVLGLAALVSWCLIIMLTIPIYLFRLVVIICAKYFRKDLDQILNGISANLVNDFFDNETPRANAVIPLIIKGHVTIEELKLLVKCRWIETNDKRFKRFCQYPVRWMGFSFYKKSADSFQIENHVYLYSKLKERTEDFVTQQDVTIFSEKLLNSPFNHFKSPWEMHLIQNYKNKKICSDSEQLSVLVFKVHHSLTDGFGLMAAFVQAFSKQTLSVLKLPKPTHQKRTLWKKLSASILLSFKLIREIGHFLLHTLRSNPWKVPDEKKQWYQLSFSSEPIPIKKFNTIRKAFGINYSSIMYSALSAGIQKSLHDLMETCKKQTSETLMTDFKDNSIYCLHVIPLPDHPLTLTNYATVSFLDLPIRKYDNPIDRLQDVNLVLRSACTSMLPWLIALNSCIVGCHFYPVIKFISKNRTVPIGATNFAIPPINLHINGKKIIAVDGIPGALDGVAGVAVEFMIFGQNIRVSVTAETAIMDRKDINRFGKYMINEIELLYSMACSVTK